MAGNIENSKIGNVEKLIVPDVGNIVNTIISNVGNNNSRKFYRK